MRGSRCGLATFSVNVKTRDCSAQQYATRSVRDNLSIATLRTRIRVLGRETTCVVQRQGHCQRTRGCPSAFSKYVSVAFACRKRSYYAVLRKAKSGRETTEFNAGDQSTEGGQKGVVGLPEGRNAANELSGAGRETRSPVRASASRVTELAMRTRKNKRSKTRTGPYWLYCVRATREYIS